MPAISKSVAEAIMTTDTRPKVASEEVKFSEGAVRVAGMTKGSGMIHPNMATTLGFVMTDAVVDSEDLEEILRPRHRSLLQFAHRRWRHVHQRHRPAHGKRRF